MSSKRTTFHWGTYDVETERGEVVAAFPIAADPDPSPIADNLRGSLCNKLRILSPMVRAGYLKSKESSENSRGREPFVPVSWEYAEKLVAEELTRVRRCFGNEAIFAGSYGWGSAGRFHHAQGQLHRFLHLIGGCTRSVNTYSFAAAEVILPHVIGQEKSFISQPSNWPNLINKSELFVAFGGLPVKNSQVTSGGLSQHLQKEYMYAASKSEIKFINVSPVKSDILESLESDWISIVPNSDVAFMLGLAFTIVSEGLQNKAFLERYCVGFDRVKDYLFGLSDGTAKTPEWASSICGVSANSIVSLARRMAEKRTILSASWSLTRQDHGEQNYWMLITLASLLGQIGLPGGGFAFGYAAENKVGVSGFSASLARFAQGLNPVSSFIPVARISDMLLNPNSRFSYNGRDYSYPDIKLIYWVGGNPFHHHQDLGRLDAAWQRPQTIICNEIYWTATARRCDIVLPVASSLERNDIGGSPAESSLLAMKQACSPVGEARSDYEVFSGIANRLGVGDRFTEGFDEFGWLKRLYKETKDGLGVAGEKMPSFNRFWKEGEIRHSSAQKNYSMLKKFRDSPASYPLSTPSGKIELFSQKISDFNYQDCPGQAVWIEPNEWLGSEKSKFLPLHLITNQPADRLHSQLDFGPLSISGKVNGREKIVINPNDAIERSLKQGDIVRVFNDRGALLAGVEISSSVRSRVVQMATGAWWDPTPGEPRRSLCKHGNVNVLTKDQGTSSLAQGPTALSCLVQIELYRGNRLEVTAHESPEILSVTEI